MRACLVFVLLFCSIVCRAQTASVVFNRKGAPLPGLDCDFKLVTSGVDCKKVVVAVNDGSVEKAYDCYYRFRADRPGKVVFTFSVKTANALKKIGEQSVTVNKYPSPVVTLGRYKNDTEAASVIRLQQGPWVYPYDCFDVGAPRFLVYKFTVVVIREKEVVFERKHYDADKKGITFDEPTKEFMRTFRAGDLLWIKDIAAHGAGADYTELNDIRVLAK